jgi:hypothetical protein
MEVSGQLHDPVALPPKERAPGTHWIGSWVGFRAGLDAVVKRKIPSPCRGGRRNVMETVKSDLIAKNFASVFNVCRPVKIIRPYMESVYVVFFFFFFPWLHSPA